MTNNQPDYTPQSYPQGNPAIQNVQGSDYQNQTAQGQFGQPQYSQPQYGQNQFNQNQQYGQNQQAYNPQYAAQAGRQFSQQAYQNTIDTTASYTQDAQAQRVSVIRAYFEMFLGILVTAVVAFLTAYNGWYYYYAKATGTIGLWGLFIAQIAIVFVLSTRVTKMSTPVARLVFYLYAATMGFTLSTIFAIYNIGTIGIALGLSSLFFLVLTMIGLTTKRNLLKAGPILMAALITLLVVEVILLIINASGSTMLISGISVVLFAGFTMYDAQSSRALLAQYQGQPEMIKRVSILCALNLYLDFINFFINLLSLLGGSDN